MKKTLFILLGMALLVAGCASVTRDIKVETDVDPKANMAGYETYTWLGSAAILYDPDGKWEPPDFDADTEIKFLIDRELRAHGLDESMSSPDLIVAFAAGIDMASMDINIDPESKLETLENVPRGGLVLVLIDADTGKAVWAGLATGEIKDHPDEETTKKRLDFAVSSMLKQLPR